MKCTTCGEEHDTISPSHGGCWFCYCQNGDLSFDEEFDTFYHLHCLQIKLKNDPHNREAKVMAKAAGIIL